MSDFNGGTNLTNGFSTEHQFLCWKANPRLLVADAVDKWHLAPTKCCSREMRQLEGHDCSTLVIAGLIESHLKKMHLQHQASKQALPFSKGTYVPWRIHFWDLFLDWNLTDTNKNINWNDRFGSWKWQSKTFFLAKTEICKIIHENVSPIHFKNGSTHHHRG